MKNPRKRRELSAAQIARSAERKAAFRALVKTVAAMSDAQRAELAGTSLIHTVEGRTLSPTNQMLVMMQLGTAVSIVGGFRQWLAQGRCVKKGQHGASIWIPTAKKEKEGGEKDGEGEGEGAETYFITGTVFDISQTEQTALGSGDADANEETPRVQWNPGDEAPAPRNERGELLLEMEAQS